MRKTLGLLAILFCALAPIGAFAQTSSGPAPADEYFGPHHQSILEIRNRLDRFDRKSDREMLDGNAVTEIDDINTSICDWQHQYPADPWLPHMMARLMRSYHRAGAASTPRATAVLDLMRNAYPDNDETAATVAMVFGGTDLPAQTPIVMDVWARFDSMRTGSEAVRAVHSGRPRTLPAMGKIYNEVAGRDINRLAALTDGIFAFAMTLLVLDIRVPDIAGIHSEAQLWQALFALSPRLLTCVMTFLTLGVFWVGHQTHLTMLKRSDRNLTWIHIAFMFAVVLTPFSTALLATFIGFRIAIFVYWLNILLLGATLFASYKYAYYHGLFDDAAPLGLDVVERRIIVAQVLYFAAALVCLLNTRVSIALMLLIQLNYAIAPRLPWIYRQ